MKSPATLRDVARAAGVAIGTASRALNHHADVEPSLRQSVLKAAERLRYRPLREARAKPENATRKASGNIGLVLIGMADSLADLPVIASMIQGVERAAAARGNNLLLANVPVLDEVPRFVQEGSVDGLIVKS
ncbi:MAG TPA: LacI family DNA-binding transcriptional regulator, partial [Planctomycetota bacterium]|nr:LacI family DNA-binding transcriptional regulator [Planctomycetota bacterium]